MLYAVCVLLLVGMACCRFCCSDLGLQLRDDHRRVRIRKRNTKEGDPLANAIHRPPPLAHRQGDDATGVNSVHELLRDRRWEAVVEDWLDLHGSLRPRRRPFVVTDRVIGGLSA